jgi:hypothetical protein
VGLPTHTSKKPFFHIFKKNVFLDISCPLGGFCPLGSIFGAFFQAPRRAEKNELFPPALEVSGSHIEGSMCTPPSRGVTISLGQLIGLKQA